MSNGFNNIKGLNDLNGYNFLLYGSDNNAGCATNNGKMGNYWSKWFDDTDISGNGTGTATATSKNRYKPKGIMGRYPTPDTGGLFYKLVMFLLIYFILYLFVSLFFSIETLFFVFNVIDFIVIIGLIFYALFGLTLDTLYFIKYIWFSIKPFFIDITYLLYLVIFILGLWFFLYLFRSKFEISKPFVLSLIEGFSYVLFIIVAMIDVLQLVFSMPLVNILEKDIDVQYNSAFGYENEPPPAPPANNCVNINTIKDPEAIRSFYDLQMTNYKLMTDYYNQIKPPGSYHSHDKKYKEDIEKYKSDLNSEFKNGTPENTKKSKYMPKSMFDKNIELTMKYWIDNSSNIMRDVKKGPKAP